MDYFTRNRDRHAHVHRVHHRPTINLDHRLPSSSSSSSAVHVHVVFRRRFQYQFYEQSSDGARATLLQTYDESPRNDDSIEVCLDAFLFEDQRTALYQALSRELERWDIPEQTLRGIMANISRIGYQIKDSVSSNMGRDEVITLLAEILDVRELVLDEREWVNLAIRESMAESEEGRRHRMVPASKSAIFKALKIERMDCGDRKEDDHHDDIIAGSTTGGECRGKRRRVEQYDESDQSTCTICMEVLPAGAYVSRMPCSHRFHGQCIVKWLKTSHFCPVCRFQIPTN